MSHTHDLLPFAQTIRANAARNVSEREAKIMAALSDTEARTIRAISAETGVDHTTLNATLARWRTEGRVERVDMPKGARNPYGWRKLA